MTMDLSARFGAHPSMVLAAYLEPLARGRRVAVFGDATAGLAERISERGARLVHAYDPEPSRAAEAASRGGSARSSGLQHAALAPDLGVRDGAFDLVIVQDLSLFADPAELLRRARRLLGSSGVAVVATPNAEAARQVVPAAPAAAAGNPVGYYELYDLVALQFSRVKMVGQSPFVGYAVADFAQEDEEPEVSVDTSLLEASEEPEWFLAIASERNVALDPFAVVEVPFAALAPSEIEPATAPRGTLAGRPDPRLAEAESRLAMATAELEQMKQRQRAEARDLEARSSATAAMSARLVELEAEVASKTARLRDVEGKVGDDHVRAERLTHDLREMEEELRRQRDRATRLSKQLDDEKKARTKADVELGMIRQKPELSGAKDRLDALAAELDASRARVAELDAARAAAEAERRRPDPALTARVAELEAAMRDAQHEVADLAAQRDGAHARVGELEQALAGAERERDELMVQYGSVERRWMALANEREQAASEALSAEVAALEATLRERGATVAKLTADLRESERIAKELLLDLEELRGGNGAAAGPAGAPAGGSHDETASLEERLDALAQGAARAEADLQAASWKIAELERRLAEAELGRAGGAGEVVHRELEQALVAAHQELASLRRALAAESALAAEPGRGVVEQSVLLEQVAGQRPPS